MWFRTLSLIIATALIVKAAIALAIPHRFYAARQRQYASSSRPPELIIPPVIVISVTAVAWYATAFHYQDWGWVVTAALTLLCAGSLDHLVRWRHREFMARVVANPKVWQVDCLLLVVGAGFVALGLLVY